MRPVGDQRQAFIFVLAATWLVLIALPLTLSVLMGTNYGGLPLLGVVLWFGLLRLARFLSPPVRADRLIRRGKYAPAVAWCDRALAVTGQNAWTGARRLIWLNRRATALLALGRAEEALATALDATRISADPQTLANCAAALLELNRYDEAASAARLTLSLTRERSVSANATLAAVMLARGMPAEAEALARAGLADIESLLPLVHPEHHAACLAALCRAQRALGQKENATASAARLRKVAGRNSVLQAQALMQRAELLGATPEEHAPAFQLLDRARARAPRALAWYLGQPGTLASLRETEGMERLLAAVTAAQPSDPAPVAPTPVEVTAALVAAKPQAAPRPAPQSSRAALLAQVLTLSGTVALLIVWTVRFFVAST